MSSSNSSSQGVISNNAGSTFAKNKAKQIIKSFDSRGGEGGGGRKNNCKNNYEGASSNKSGN